jgi:hypothetical protein
MKCPNCRSVRSTRTAGQGRWRCLCGHRWIAVSRTATSAHSGIDQPAIYRPRKD